MVKFPEQPQKEKIVRKLLFKEQFNSPINSVQTDPPQGSNIQGEMNKWFRLHDETNPAASVAVRHLFQQLINDNMNVTEYLHGVVGTKLPCNHLLEVRSDILNSNLTFSPT